MDPSLRAVIIIAAFLIVSPLAGYLVQRYNDNMHAGPQEPAPANDSQTIKQWVINLF
jgi:hypothetical protein